jgi:hypothetical protein
VLVTSLLIGGCRTEEHAPTPAADSSAMRTVHDVIDAHSAELLKVPGVVGVYEGETSKHRPCVRIMVVKLTSELESRLPRRLEGYPVEIEESGEIQPMRDSS